MSDLPSRGRKTSLQVSCLRFSVTDHVPSPTPFSVPGKFGSQGPSVGFNPFLRERLTLRR